MNGKKLKCLWPARREAEEQDMQEELKALAGMAGPGELGNLTLAAESARATWHWTAFDGVWADIRYALRTLRRQPMFVAVAVISLALGGGANGALFSLADAVLLRPLPVPEPSEVLSVSNSTPAMAVEGLSYPDYRDLRAASGSFSALVAYHMPLFSIGTTASAPPQIRITALVSDNFFTGLGVAPSLGRDFLAQEGSVPGRDRIAILGYGFWKSEYGGNPGVIGRSLRVNGVNLDIVGVAPESFPGMELLYRACVFVPMSMTAQLSGERESPLENRGLRNLSVYGRLKAGATLASARAELATVGENLERAYPQTNRQRHVAVRTELDARIRQSPARLALVVMLAVLAGLVLLIGCANVANLMLARARARVREIAVRLAIGAGRLRLIRQLMIESLVLALLGGAGGLILAYGGMQFLGRLEIASDIPMVFALEMDTRVLAVSMLVVIGSSILFGLVPALQAARTNLVPALKSSGGAMPARRRTIGRNVLVVSQIAMAMVLLITAGLFLDGLDKAIEITRGSRRDHLISMVLDPSLLRYSPNETRRFYRRLVDRVRALPQVRSVALAEAVPYSPSQSFLNVIPEGYRFPKDQEKAHLFGGAYSETSMNTMQVGMIRGRSFTVDDRAESRPVAVVNQEFANIYWPNQDAIGKRIRLDRADSRPVEVIGVARTEAYLFPTEPPRPFVYLPYEQNLRSRMTLIAEAYGDPGGLAAPLRDAVRAIDPAQPVLNLRTIASYETRAVSNWAIFLQAFGAMALVGLLLAMAGLYGLISYSVSRRTPEIGVRMAMGASRADVLRLVLREGLALAAVGIVLGGVLAALVAPALARGMVSPGAWRVAIFIGVPAGLLLASAAACYVPARRAAMLDPIRALWCE